MILISAKYFWINDQCQDLDSLPNIYMTGQKLIFLTGLLCEFNSVENIALRDGYRIFCDEFLRMFFEFFEDFL